MAALEILMKAVYDANNRLHGDDGRFAHQAFAPEAKDVAAYHEAVTRWYNLPAGMRRSGSDVHLGRTPAVLRMLSVGDLKVQIDRDTLIKVSRPHGIDPKGHGITLEQMKAVIFQIADPVAVFRTKKDKDEFEILTEMRDVTGEQVMVALHAGKRVGRLVINDVSSVYGRPSRDFLRWAESGALLYFNKEKAPDTSYDRLAVIALDGSAASGDLNIKTPADVVKFHEAEDGGLSKSLTFIKAYVASHSRTLPDGRVVRVAGYSNRRGRSGGHQMGLFGNTGMGVVHTGRRIDDEDMHLYDHTKTADLFAAHDDRILALKAQVDAFRRGHG